MDNTIIEVRNVSKKFCRSLRSSILYGVEDISWNIIGRPARTEKLRSDEFWAVDDISFDVRKGEVLSIIGINGSGKSTNLKMLNGIYMPDKGSIRIMGRVAALIELEAGIHP